MRVRALVVLLAAAVAALLPVAAAGPAAAGGPTSVLMSSPVLGRTSSLYTADDGYQALADYVDAFGSDTGGSGGGPNAHAVGNEITLTWLIHDVSVWRVDRVYPDAMGGPWIATQQVLDGSTDIWSAPVRWHRSGQPKALLALLAAHGLAEGSDLPAGSVRDVTAQQYAAAPDPAGSRGARPTSTEPATGDTGRTVLALVVGLLVGAAATAAAATVLARRRAEVGSGEVDGGGSGAEEPDWTPEDVLTSTR